jgi:hypothetical protein
LLARRSLEEAKVGPSIVSRPHLLTGGDVGTLATPNAPLVIHRPRRPVLSGVVDFLTGVHRLDVAAGNLPPLRTCPRGRIAPKSTEQPGP